MKVFEFAKFDRDQIEKEINLKAEAEKDGGLNRPPANAKEKSSAERLAIKKSRELLDKEINKASNWLTPLIKTIDNLSLKIKKRHWNIQTTKNRIRENIGKATTTLESQKMVFDKEHQDVESFRNLHGIGRQPNIASFPMIIVQIGIVIFLFALESFANMELLATAIGKREGLMYSASVAAINVLLSALVGYFILKGAINYESGNKKIFLNIFMFVYAIIIIYINCVLGAIRAISDKINQEVSISGFAIGGGEDNALAFWAISADWTPLSLVLTFIGIIFAAVSLADAYYFKDVFPGYSDAAKKRENARKIIERDMDNLIDVKGKIFSREHSSANILKKELTEKDLTTLNDESKKIVQIFNGYSNYVFSVQRGIKEMLETYRGINGQVRSDNIRPDYWNEKFKLDDHYLKPELKFGDYYFSGDSIQTRMVEEQKRITDEHSEYEKALNIYEKEIDNEIMELKQKYALA